MTSEVHDNPEAYIHWLYINTKRDRKKNDANMVCRASNNNNVSVLLFKRDILLLMQYYFLVLFSTFYCVNIFIICLISFLAFHIVTLLTIVLSVLLRYTDSDCPFGIFKLFLYADIPAPQYPKISLTLLFANIPLHIISCI